MQQERKTTKAHSGKDSTHTEPRDQFLGRTRGICYVLCRSMEVALELIHALRGSTLTAPNQSRHSAGSKGDRVRYVISADLARRPMSQQPRGLADHITAEDA